MKTALYYHPPPTKPKKTAQVTSFCNPNSKQTPCLLLFLLFFLLLLLTKTKQTKTRQNRDKTANPGTSFKGWEVLAPSAGNPEPSEVQDQMPEMFCSAGFVCCTNKDPRKTRRRDEKHEQKKIGPTKKNTHTHTCFRWWAVFWIEKSYAQILQGHGGIN